MPQPAKSKDDKFTYRDYLTWPDEERWELIDGIAYDMTPAPSRNHQRLSAALTSKLYNYLEDKDCEVYAAPFDVRMPRGNENEIEIDTIVQPDISVICDPEKLDEKGCLGAPDLIIEITSPSTAKKDVIEKFNLYERVGVREYWIVRPQEKTVTVFKLGKDKKYGRPDVYSAEDEIKVGIFEDLSIKLAEVFGEEKAEKEKANNENETNKKQKIDKK
ncbi:MAG: hypothetical protein PWR10_1225 [Halanaerobiales bacterium]|nr:hypothetical protein [Halanaerobiales bacterium]